MGIVLTGTVKSRSSPVHQFFPVQSRLRYFDAARINSADENCVDWGFGPVAYLLFGAGGLGHEAGGLRPPLASPAPTSLTCPHQSRQPPPASPAPIGLACPHGEEQGSALALGIGLRLWQSGWSFPSLSFVSNNYTLGLSARSILIGRVNLPCGVCGSVRYSGGYSGGYPHVDSGLIPKTYKFLECHRSC
jgi:hypothetical protein